MQKLRTPVSLPQEWQFSSTQLRLRAVIVHKGHSYESGRYITYAREGGTWITYDDSVKRLEQRLLGLALTNSKVILHERVEAWMSD